MATDMKFIKDFLKTSLFSCFLLLSICPAHAYIDPNTGSLLLQILTPIVGIVIFTWKFIVAYVNKAISKLFRNKKIRHIARPPHLPDPSDN
ncbi:hypothetical protein COO92_12410 [Thalassospira lohafexi]|uniref:Uncharacterized protein n=1 Tax=Thalassospira lohafexi TaxID=744227 RepID=A0A2N3L6W6_9PROT|nr:hypothetical protein COO92_12410 [Thalassospira lohafexi]